MGTAFFKQKPGAAPGGNLNQLGRALNSGAYAAHGDAIGAQKALAGAQGANAAAIKAHGPIKGGSAYPKGPKV
jgi:hypothetical protein